MTRFLIDARNEAGELRQFWYDNQTSALMHYDHTPVDLARLTAWQGPSTDPVPPAVSEHRPGRKTRQVKKLKIQLGLSCNYSCDYCSQRFVPNADETNRHDVEPFVAQLEGWFDGGEDGLGEGVQIQFWGGEPFVYWKTFKPLAERLRQRYPNASLRVCTNGSLLDAEKNAWLDAMGFSVAVSHDGPGQFVRGPDPLNDSKQRAAILDLFARLHPQKRISFSAMMNRQNMSRAAVVEFFQKTTGALDVMVGEGAFIDPYDEGGMASSLQSSEDEIAFRRLAIHEIATGKVAPHNMLILNQKVSGFVHSILHGRPASAVSQKCGMDRNDHLAIDLKGSVLTCQNVSSVAVAPNGKSHRIGHVEDFDAIALDTATSWQYRKDCQNCPVLQLCGGSCMFLAGPLWDGACNNAFSDNVVFFAFAFQILTGCLPLRITGGRQDREAIWEAATVKPRRVIPIRVAS